MRKIVVNVSATSKPGGLGARTTLLFEIPEDNLWTKKDRREAAEYFAAAAVFMSDGRRSRVHARVTGPHGSGKQWLADQVVDLLREQHGMTAVRIASSNRDPAGVRTDRRGDEGEADVTVVVKDGGT